MEYAQPARLPFPRSRAAQPTLEVATCAYLQHMRVKMLRGKLARDHFGNVDRYLRGFADAWRVVFTDGRQVLLPLTPPPNPPGWRWRRRPPPRTASNAAEAIAWARELFPGPDCHAEARRNGDTQLGDASNDDLDLWILANPQWGTENAKANVVAAILNCFSWHDDVTGDRSPYRRRLAPKFVRERRRNASQAEYEAMTGRGCADGLRIALWALWHVDGMRPSEIYDLRWPHFHDRGELASTLEVPHKTQGKTGKLKVIPLTPRAYEFFRELRRLKVDEVVFHNEKGGPLNRRCFGGQFRKRRIALGLDETLTPYTLRHAYATDAVSAGVPKDDLAMLLGHRGTQMVDSVYSHAEEDPGHVCKVARQAEAKIDKLRTSRRKTPSEIQGELFD